MQIKILFFYLAGILFSGCATIPRNAGPVVSDIGERTEEYRAVQNEIGSGQAELAITGANLENGISNLEQSIISSEDGTREIDGIIRKVRDRKVDSTFVEEWRDSRIEKETGR